jgi:hypothetical protein
MRRPPRGASGTPQAVCCVQRSRCLTRTWRSPRRAGRSHGEGRGLDLALTVADDAPGMPSVLDRARRLGVGIVSCAWGGSRTPTRSPCSAVPNAGHAVRSSRRSACRTSRPWRAAAPDHERPRLRARRPAVKRRSISIRSTPAPSPRRPEGTRKPACGAVSSPPGKVWPTNCSRGCELGACRGRVRACARSRRIPRKTRSLVTFLNGSSIESQWRIPASDSQSARSPDPNLSPTP